MVVSVERTQIIEMMVGVTVPTPYDSNYHVSPSSQRSKLACKMVDITVGISTIPDDSWKDEWGFRYRHTLDDNSPLPFYTYLLRTREDYELWLASDRLSRRSFMSKIDSLVSASRYYSNSEFYIPVLTIDLEDDLMNRLRIGARVVKVAAPAYPTTDSVLVSRDHRPYETLQFTSDTIPIHLVIFDAIERFRRVKDILHWKWWRRTKISLYNLEEALKAIRI